MRPVKNEFSPTVFEKLGNGFDSVLSIVAPRMSLKRRHARIQTKMLGRVRTRMGSYKGSEKDRTKAFWSPGSGSADYDILDDLDDLRNRSRDMVRNDGYAAGIIDTFVNNVIGTGINPQSKAEDETFRKDAEALWGEWGDFADATEQNDLSGLEELTVRQILDNGEVFALRVDKEDRLRPVKTAYQLIESDRIYTPMEFMTAKDVRAGIRIGKYGEPISAFIQKTHPGDYNFNYRTKNYGDFDEVPFRDESGRLNLIHLYRPARPGQTRGVPILAPVLHIFKMLSEYLEAELVANLMAACFGIFITKENAAELGAVNFNRTNASGQREIDIEPGMVEYLEPGEQISSFTPNRPGTQFDSFVVRLLRLIGSAVGLPLELVSRDFSKTNYSSARAALLEARRVFKRWQKWISSRFLQPMWDSVIEQAVLERKLSAPNFYSFPRKYLAATWIAPGWQWVDPLKEARASIESLKSGLSNFSTEIAAQGGDWEEHLEQCAREQKKIKELEEKYGIKIIQDNKPAEQTPAENVEDVINEQNT